MDRYICLKCGRCCHEVKGSEDDPTYKRIPLYPEEADRLEAIAKERNIPLHIIEDVVFPDSKNQRVLVLTWRILLDNDEQVCPFHDPAVGCTIHDQKPLACKAYPLALKSEDAFTSKIEIDPICKFTEMNREFLEQIDFETLKNVYDVEFQHAMNLLKRNKSAIMQLRALEISGKIEIPKTISTEEFNEFLKSKERMVIE